MIIFVNELSQLHRNGYNHPESQKRMSALLKACRLEEYKTVDIDINKRPEPQLIHTNAYIEKLEKVSQALMQSSESLGCDVLAQIDEDTYIAKGSVKAAYNTLALIEQAVDGLYDSGDIPFVVSRPPGHHALSDGSMGFCLFGNCAYGARYAQKKPGIEKVAIIDWDVHHGNGTESLLYQDSSILSASVHAYPYWPEGCGAASERGEGANLNLPMPQEAGDLQYLEYFDRYLIPELNKFQPDMIIVAAGFDAHHLERNSSLQSKSLMAVTDAGYSHMTQRLRSFADAHCNGRLMFVLEGGYYVPSLVSGFKAVVDTINTGRTYSESLLSQGQDMDMGVFKQYCRDIEAVL